MFDLFTTPPLHCELHRVIYLSDPRICEPKFILYIFFYLGLIKSEELQILSFTFLEHLILSY